MNSPLSFFDRKFSLKSALFVGNFSIFLILTALQGYEINNVALSRDKLGNAQTEYQQGAQIPKSLLFFFALTTTGSLAICIREHLIEAAEDLAEFVGNLDVDALPEYLPGFVLDFVGDRQTATTAHVPATRLIKKKSAPYKPRLFDQSPQSRSEEFEETKSFKQLLRGESHVDEAPKSAAPPMQKAEIFDVEKSLLEGAFSAEPEFVIEEITPEIEIGQTIQELTRFKNVRFSGKKEGFSSEQFFYTCDLEPGASGRIKRAAADIVLRFPGILKAAGNGVVFEQKRSEREFPDFVIPKFPEGSRLPFLVGYDNMTKEPVIGDYGFAPGSFTCGLSRRGKDVYQRQKLASMLATQTPKTLRVALVDVSTKQLSDYTCLTNSPFLLEHQDAMALTKPDVHRLLRELNKISKERAAAFKEEEAKGNYVSNIWEYRKLGHEMPVILVVVGETKPLFENDQTMQDLFIRKAGEDAAQGIVYSFGTQYNTGSAAPKALRRNCSHKTCFQMDQDESSETVFNVKQPVSNLLLKGNAIYSPSGDKYVEIQTAEVTQEMLGAIAHRRDLA